MGACSGGHFQWHSFFGFQRNPPLPGLEEKERMEAIGAPPGVRLAWPVEKESKKFRATGSNGRKGHDGRRDGNRF